MKLIYDYNTLGLSLAITVSSMTRQEKKKLFSYAKSRSYSKDYFAYITSKDMAAIDIETQFDKIYSNLKYIKIQTDLDEVLYWSIIEAVYKYEQKKEANIFDYIKIVDNQIYIKEKLAKFECFAVKTNSYVLAVVGKNLKEIQENIEEQQEIQKKYTYNM